VTDIRRLRREACRNRAPNRRRHAVTPVTGVTPSTPCMFEHHHMHIRSRGLARQRNTCNGAGWALLDAELRWSPFTPQAGRIGPTTRKGSNEVGTACVARGVGGARRWGTTRGLPGPLFRSGEIRRFDAPDPEGLPCTNFPACQRDRDHPPSAKPRRHGDGQFENSRRRGANCNGDNVE
jgi:hypothetical protein